MRLGTVSYLNARPLVFRFLREEMPGIQLVQAVPSELVARLRVRELDAALISSIECYRDDGFNVLRGAGIVSHGAVLSIRLICRRPPQEVRSVALDTSSRSAAALTRILFREYWRAEPEFTARPPDLVAMLRDCDAALLIGDPALRHAASTSAGGSLLSAGGGPQVYDLGQVWRDFTGLPFVFAMWAGWPGAFDDGQAVWLLDAKEYGKARLAEIAELESRSLGLPADLCRTYLGGAIQYDVGPAEWNGLQRFLALAREHGLL